MKIGIGIDTGGTCTDAVAYDFETGTFLAKGKSLTTREDLSIGIGNALDFLPPEYIQQAVLVSLSTTLATNASIEGKGCRAKLMLFGLSDDFVEYNGNDARYGLKREAYRCVVTRGSYYGLLVDEPDWDNVMAEYGAWLKDADALAASEIWHYNTGARSELKFKSLVEENYGLNTTIASELANSVNVLADGATVLLNARLLPVMQEFVDAAIHDFKARGCNAPIMVVRSDGTLMSSDFARTQPVESVLSGPAASVLAGKSFADKANYVIVDMGGTSTDISVVSGGKPVIDKNGTRIGSWRTNVRGVQVTPFNLGGDTTLRIQGYTTLHLTARRSTPLCVAATRWPEVKSMLNSLLTSKHVNKFPLHEFYYLQKEPADYSRFTDEEQTLIRLLKNGPCILNDVEKETGISLYFFDSERLESEGIVMRCGMTPTDFMHIKGDYAEYDREASVIAAKYMLLTLGRQRTDEEVDKLADEAYEIVEGYMYENIASILLAQKYPRMFAENIDDQTRFLIQQSWNERKSENPVESHLFSTKTLLIGIGAPTHIFLPEVAKALDAECMLPEHADVANALGALMAEVDVVRRVEVSRIRTAMGEVYYVAHLPKGSKRFERLDDALVEAEPAAIEAVIAEARARGAMGDLEPKTHIEHRGEYGSAVVSEVLVQLGKKDD